MAFNMEQGKKFEHWTGNIENYPTDSVIVPDDFCP